MQQSYALNQIIPMKLPWRDKTLPAREAQIVRLVQQATSFWGELAFQPRFLLFDKNKVPLDLEGKPLRDKVAGTQWSFFDAVTCFADGVGAGVGVMTGAVDGISLCAVDLDDCLTEEGIAAWAHPILSAGCDYVEVSRSGKGLHLLARGEKPEGATRCKRRLPGEARAAVEAYDHGRYIALTGNVSPGSSGVTRRMEAVDCACRTFLREDAPLPNGVAVENRKGRYVFDIRPEKAEAEAVPPPDAADAPPPSGNCPDWREAVQRAFASPKAGARIRELYERPPEESEDASADDMALMNHLAYWLDCDASAMQEAFLRSARGNRAKAERADYLERTIRRAILSQGGREEAARPRRSAPQPQPLRVYAADELARMEMPELRWIVEEILPEGVHLLVGAPKIGKSFLVLDLCLRVVRGEALWDFATRRCEALYLALEDGPRRLRDRMERLLPPGEAPPGGLYTAYQSAAIAGGLEQQILQQLDAHPEIKLVVIDTLQKVRPPETRGNAYAADYAAIAPLLRVARERHVAVLLVHHLNKMKAEKKGDVMDRISGSTGLSGAVDSSLVLEYARGEGIAKMTCAGRDVESRELYLVRNGARWEVGEPPEDAEFEATPGDEATHMFLEWANAQWAQDVWEGSAAALKEAIEAHAKEPIDMSPGMLVRQLTRRERLLAKHGIRMQRSDTRTLRGWSIEFGAGAGDAMPAL